MLRHPDNPFIRAGFLRVPLPAHVLFRWTLAGQFISPTLATSPSSFYSCFYVLPRRCRRSSHLIIPVAAFACIIKSDYSNFAHIYSNCAWRRIAKFYYTTTKLLLKFSLKHGKINKKIDIFSKQENSSSLYIQILDTPRKRSQIRILFEKLL